MLETIVHVTLLIPQYDVKPLDREKENFSSHDILPLTVYFTHDLSRGRSRAGTNDQFEQRLDVLSRWYVTYFGV